MVEKIGLVGLGAIGHELAKNVIERGIEVHGFRRGDASAFSELGGILADSPKALAETCDIIFTCLPNHAAVEQATSGENGLIKAGRDGLIIVDLNTLRPLEKETTRKAVEAAGCHMLDAPLLGTPRIVEARNAVIFASGGEQHYQKVKPVFEAMTERHTYLGAFGNGIKMKLIANCLVGIHAVAAAEIVTLAHKAGVDPEQMITLLSASAADSTQFKVRAPMMKDKAFEPALATCSLLDKDMTAIVSFLDDIEFTGNLTRLAAGYMARTRTPELTDKDCAAVVEILADEAGVSW